MTSWHPGDGDYHDPSILRIPTKLPAQHGMTKGNLNTVHLKKNPGVPGRPWCFLIFRRSHRYGIRNDATTRW